LQLANSPENKKVLESQTPRAIERGIFGAPDLVVGNELFWGGGRLEDAIDWALMHG
jgi:2-hydroxychromene-2-carboxylate isomerase